MNPRLLSRLAGIAFLAAASGVSLAQELLQYVPVAKDARAPQLAFSPSSVRIDVQAIAAAREGAPLNVTLPNGHKVVVRIDHITRHDNGDLSWVGKTVDHRGEFSVIGTSGAAGTYAELETPEGTWGIVPSQGGYDWIFDKTTSDAGLPPPATLEDTLKPPREPGMHAKATCPTVGSMPSTQAIIDVLAVITPDFVNLHGGASGAETRLNNIFASLNAYNAASNIAVTYRRVATIYAEYQAASTANDDDAVALRAITNPASNGPFRNVPALRNFFGADMVAMFRGPKSTNGNSISGIAWLTGDENGGMSPSDANYMYSVSGDWLYPGATLAAHELGHNLGNAHDRPNAGTGPGTVGSTPYAYGHFVCGARASGTCGQEGANDTGTGFGTIMSYHRPTVAKFSSPNLSCRGPYGDSLTAPCGVAGQQDDVRATNCVRQTVAAFRTSWVGTCASLAADADSDGIPDCVEAGSGRINGVRDNDIFSSALLFSAQQYRDFLSREGDAGGLNFWITGLNAAAQTRVGMIEGFFNSAEFQGVIAPVARLYFAYFRRIPDYSGLQYWIGQYRAGVPLGQISAYFAASPEFGVTYGALSNSQFVSLIYQNVLGRAPDATGLAYWTNQLDTAARSRGDVMLQFSESVEYRGLIASDVYVTMMYAGMLRRAPDAGGFSYWVDYLDTGNSGQALISGFLASPEYRTRFLP